MIVSIMQPYFFPYIGYFQLAACSDIFVFHDDVQYIKGGWVNRNRILRDGQPRWLTLPVRKGASRLTIQQRQYQLDEPVTARVLRRVEA
jgi:WbqC-like protein family